MKLQIHDLCKQFDGHLVLDHVSMELVSGHIYCLMAPSGTGKTTLFRILMGLEHADSGEIIVQRKTKEAGQAADEKVADWQENETLQNLCIGAVFQEDRLCEAFSAVENVLMTADSSMSRAEAERELRELLPQEALNRPVATLSGGQKRRVALCRALCAPSDLLILDEPFTGLDAETRMEGIRYLQKKSAGKLTLLSTHQEDDIPTLNGIRITI
ncbi:MAG TPA: ABC transporter [Lachnoclostridium sp.]|nr:ABC transporter [Lachnoclostridium sp.]